MKVITIFSALNAIHIRALESFVDDVHNKET